MFTDLVERGRELLAKHNIDPEGVLLVYANEDGYLWRETEDSKAVRKPWPSNEAREDFRPLFDIQ